MRVITAVLHNAKLGGSTLMMVVVAAATAAAAAALVAVVNSFSTLLFRSFPCPPPPSGARPRVLKVDVVLKKKVSEFKLIHLVTAADWLSYACNQHCSKGVEKNQFRASGITLKRIQGL